MSTTNLDFGKMPPQAVDLEEAVLGAIMLEKDAFLVVADLLSPSIFYKSAHQDIYKACLDLFMKNEPIDILTVTEQLKKNGKLDEVGGAFYVTKLIGRIGSSVDLGHHSKMVFQKYVARELIRVGSEMQNRAYDDSMDIEDIIEYSQNELFGLVINKQSSKSIAEIGQARLRELIKMAESKDPYTGVPSGFLKLDRITSGWQDTDLIIVAGRPSMGKSTVALEFAINAAQKGFPVDIYSLEMSDSQLYDKVLSRKTGIENSYIRTAKMDDRQWDLISNLSNEIHRYPIYIDQTPSLNVIEFKAKARRNLTKYGTKIIIVDYIQLMRSPEAFKKGGREQEVSNISSQLKATAKELKVPIIALSQLNRSVETRGGEKRPQLSDLRESGSIEQDADLVIFIHRLEFYGITEKANGETTKNHIDIIIAKHRNGVTGDVSLWKNNNWTEISEFREGSDINDMALPYNETEDAPWTE